MEIVTNCSVPNCDGLCNIVFNGERAVITVFEFYKIVRHWEQKINNICGQDCRYEKLCTSHRRLNFVKMLKESVLKRNRSDQRIKTFEMELIRNCEHNICMNNWYFNILKKTLQWEFSKDGYKTVFFTIIV